MNAETGQGVLRDGELLDLYASLGEEWAFEEIVRRHGGMVLSICRRVCGERTAGEDAAQQVFAALAGKAGSLRSRQSLAGWLHRAAWHTAMRHRRAEQVRRRHEGRAGEMALAAGLGTAWGPADIEERRETLSIVLHALWSLPEVYREALVLHHVEGYTIAQAAELLGTRPGTVAARVSRGRELLRAKLAESDLEPTAPAVAPAVACALAMDAQALAEDEQAWLADACNVLVTESAVAQGGAMAAVPRGAAAGEPLPASAAALVIERAVVPGSVACVLSAIKAPVFAFLLIGSIGVLAANPQIVRDLVPDSRPSPASKSEDKQPRPEARDSHMPSAPEPSGAALAALGGMLALGRRRRK